MGNLINQRLQLLPVNELKEAKHKTIVTDTKSIYPVWAKQASAIRAEIDETGDVDAIFKKNEEPKEVPTIVQKPTEPDYLVIIKQSMSLQSVADNGAVFNGRFYKTGAQLDEFAVTRMSGGLVVPNLAAVSDRSVTVSVGSQKFDLSLPEPF